MKNIPQWEKCFVNLGNAFEEIKVRNEDNNHVCIKRFDLTEFRLKLGVRTPFFYIKDISAFTNSEEFYELKGRSKPSFIIYRGEKPKFKFFSPLVFISENRLADITEKLKLENLMLKALQEHCSLEVLSPYETDAAVFGDQFFGRKTEIDRIITHDSTNFTIFGSRRMGKTSLLKQLEYMYNNKIFSEQPKLPNSGKAVFLSCIGVKDLNGFIELLMSGLAPADYWRWKGKVIGKLEKKRHSGEIFFQSYFRQFSGKYKKGVLLLLDEVDSMYESNEGNEIARYQKMLTDVGYRFIQTGYRTVWQEMQNNKNILFNFSQPLPMAQFTQEDSLELIKKPMENMGIKFSEGVSNVIYQETGGIPNYIQHYCSVIVSVAKSRHKMIDKSVFGLVDGDLNFDRIVMNSFNQNIRKPIEKLIIYIVTVEFLTKFSIDRILYSCNSWGLDTVTFDDINRSLNILKMMGFVQSVGAEYRVIAPIITKSLRKREIEKKLAEVVREIKTKND